MKWRREKRTGGSWKWKMGGGPIQKESKGERSKIMKGARQKHTESYYILFTPNFMLCMYFGIHIHVLF